MYLIFDTETTGLPKSWSAPITDTNNWPRCIQIAWQLHDEMGNLVEHQDYLVRPEGFNIPYDAERIHGISTELAAEQGILMEEVGELSRIMVRKYGEQSFKGQENEQALADEMADVLWVLICLANQTGVNLTEALQKNIEKKTLRDKDRHKNNPKL